MTGLPQNGITLPLSKLMGFAARAHDAITGTGPKGGICFLLPLHLICLMADR